MRATEIFSNKALTYYRGRPRWPETLLDSIVAETEIHIDSVIVEIGSGTGNLAAYFINHGYIVYCVEPNEDMRQLAESRFASKENYISINGTATIPNLPETLKADLLVVGQALHWWHDERERARAIWQKFLKPKGKLAILFYNTDQRSQITIDIHSYLYRNCAQYRNSQTPLINPPAFSLKNIRPYIEASSINRETEIKMDQLALRWSEFIQLIFSYSFTPDPHTYEAKILYPGLKTIFDKHQISGIIQIPYMVQKTVGLLNRD